MTIMQLNGEAIRLGRAMRKMTREDLARATHIKTCRLQAIERDKSPARPNELAKILKALTTGD